MIEGNYFYFEKAKGELQAIEVLKEEMDGLKGEIEKVKKDVSRISPWAFSKKEGRRPRGIVIRLSRELSELNMKKTRFAVKILEGEARLSSTTDGFPGLQQRA